MSDLTLEKLFPPTEKYTFLIGAGVSMNPPSSIPSALQIVKKLIELFTPPNEVLNLLRLENLRYELTVEMIQKYIDPNLEFMNYFENITSPNIINYFLAHAIKEGSYVVTTNFDYLIEYALLSIIQDKEKIKSIITKEDYIRIKDPFILQERGECAVYKIHGSKKNIITGSLTQESLVTTITAFGKEREEGETFALESYKKPVIYNLMKDRTLIVMGYSGKDDFDIGPTLRELHGIKKLIWINHDPAKNIRLKQYTDISHLYDDNLSKGNRILFEILKQSIDLGNQIEVFRIDANTIEFVNNILWKFFIRDIDKPILNLEGSKKIEFSDWIGTIPYKFSKYMKFHVAHDIYNYLSHFKEAINCARTGLKLANKEKNLNEKATFYYKIGLNNEALNKYTLPDYKKAYRFSKKASNQVISAYSLAKIASQQLKKHMEKAEGQGFRRGEWNSFMKKYSNALKIAKELNDVNLAVSLIESIGDSFQKKAKFYTSTILFKKSKSVDAYNSALKWYKISLKLESKLGNLVGKARIYQKMGHLYSEQKEKDKSAKKLNDALEIAKQLGDNRLQRDILLKMGDLESSKKDFRKAIERKKEAVQLEGKIGIDKKATEMQLAHLKMKMWFSSTYGKIEKFCLIFLWITVFGLYQISTFTYNYSLYMFMPFILVGAVIITCITHLILKIASKFEKEKDTKESEKKYGG